jgi:hypothetical protein
MIESSVIKLILIAALNICFVWVWVKKEKLRRVNIFKNEKLSIFWAFNILYVIVTAKIFEKILDITLGFSYNIEYLKKSIQTPFFKIDYLGVKTLDEITKFLFDSGNFITLFIGLTGMLVAIYIYAISIDNKLKKFMLLTLIGKESLFYLSFYIVVLFLFGSESIFLIGPIGYLIYLLTDSVRWILKINSESSYKENFRDLMKKKLTEKEKNDLYIEVKKSLYKAVKEEELLEIEENKYYFNEYFDNYGKKLDYIEKDRAFGNVINFLNDLYEEINKNKNSRIFQKINYLHIKIADYYYKNNDEERFYRALMVMTKVYDYYHIDGTDKFELGVISGFRFDSFGIFEKYGNNLKEGIKWYCQKFKVIIEGIKKAVGNNDFYFYKQFIYLIEVEFEYKENLKRDYKLLEKSVYFGILLYLKEEKRKNQDDENKIDEFIKFMEKRILNNTDLIDLIELYEFIGEEIYGWSEEYRDRLNWDKIFQPKIELVKTRAHSVRTDGEKKKLFFRLLGKLKFNEWEKNCILTGELEQYINFNSGFNGGIEIDEDKLLERIDRFKKKSNWLLNDLKQYKKELTLTNEEYEKIRGLFEEIRIKIQNQEDRTIVDSEISQSKITIFKDKLEKILSESRVIKWLDNLGKYTEGIKEEKGKTRYIGQYMQKEFFVKIGDEDGTRAIAKYYGKRQNRVIEQIIIESIEANKGEIDSIEKALEKIKGEPWIILTGIGIHSFFYEESGKSRKNIVLSSDLDNKYFEKHGEILEGIYKYKETEIPIYNFSSDKKGIYILDSNDIEGFVHYDSFEEDKNTKNIEKRFDKKVGYSYLTIIDTEKIIENEKIEKVLKFGILKDYKTDEEKLNQFKQLVWIIFVQKGELKLKEDAEVYRVEFNG